MSDVPVPRKWKHTVGFGGEMCVFLTPGLGEPTVAVGGGVGEVRVGDLQNKQDRKRVPVTVRQVLVPAAFDPTPRERSFLPRPSRWTEQRGGEVWSDFSRLTALLLMGGGSGE